MLPKSVGQAYACFSVTDVFHATSFVGDGKATKKFWPSILLLDLVECQYFAFFFYRILRIVT